jgi:hypothetical protein
MMVDADLQLLDQDTIEGDIARLAGAGQSRIDAAMITASLMTDRLVEIFGMVLILPFGIESSLEWISTINGIQGELVNPLQIVSGVAFSNFCGKVTIVAGNTFQCINLWLENLVSLLQSLLFSFLYMACFFGLFWILFVGLNDSLPFLIVAGLYSLVHLVTLLTISINGYKSLELSISLIFSEVKGASLQNKLTIALIFWTLTILTDLPGVWFLLGIIFSKNNEINSQKDTSIQLDGSDS